MLKIQRGKMLQFQKLQNMISFNLTPESDLIFILLVSNKRQKAFILLFILIGSPVD